MQISAVEGWMERRLMIHYRVDAGVLKAMLPAPFRPRLVDGYGIAGVDLIRQRQMRIKGFPRKVGMNSDLALHRFSVEWSEMGRTRTGVYIPRRETSLPIHVIAGGRLYPGIYHLAKFRSREKNGKYAIKMSGNSDTSVAIQAKVSDYFPFESVFREVEYASTFFRKEAIGYTPRYQLSIFDGLRLHMPRWQVTPMHVSQVKVSFFENPAIFPPGSIYFDHALLVENVEYEWRRVDQLIAPRPIIWERLVGDQLV
ncbi:DUF2071 domain-containing protein [Pontibacter sp. G13]|uniref:DUF2071 domain-containing protein n=1 Tax=Pontibacter sp. G13 TaxID=3074898 RepID=UPI00288A2E4B|nr:DUF2071 domain-containing protein [Pontibacter sp. G13]WNJ16071.1 DUF2071 domain-containing protein [Pontibacter sp. G13]